ncbi:type III secretion system export apparatus subunit SctT [Candidatus Symbiopectobacterium sp. NZEC151]|uniref:type III secretion system export apparatus subunit SctT n=2 Tax=unclassified Symbiopectobacterium TaxID=2794573 RepID=UPI002226A0CE|nr:type III secretion system export apparatus subunit SctT [Candidatus Symbiopectobacterium sp. NZEC151]MCW2474856.1 type III secretion system export apparatus subunit SctT [Candidatus Symbiopectobacterium sp. NZEC151]
MLFVSLYLHFQHNVMILMLAYARLAIVFYMLPILGERVLANLIVKNTAIFLVIIGLWPCVEASPATDLGGGMVLVTELVVGLILAVTLCLPFWMVIALGELIDNQRGATISDSIDPVHGVQGSILSGFFNFAFGAIFFAQGGMRLLVEVLAASYRVLPKGSELSEMNINETGHLLLMLMQGSIMLAAPVLIVMMLSEVLLGVFSRYCPQLNPFSLSLTIKSVIAFAVFLLYGFQSLTEKPLPLFSLQAFQRFFI